MAISPLDTRLRGSGVPNNYTIRDYEENQKGYRSPYDIYGIAYQWYSLPLIVDIQTSCFVQNSSINQTLINDQ